MFFEKIFLKWGKIEDKETIKDALRPNGSHAFLGDEISCCYNIINSFYLSIYLETINLLNPHDIIRYRGQYKYIHIGLV